MNIVANAKLLKYLANIDIFQLDLGRNLKGPWDPKDTRDNTFRLKISDEFIKKYQKLTGNFIFRYGDVGTLKFYQDQKLGPMEMQIWKEEDIYEIEMNEVDLAANPRKVLSDTLQELDKFANPISLEANVISTAPDEAEKNSASLTKEELLEKIKAKRRKESPLPQDEKLLAFIERKRKENRERYGYV
jgi:hypothetical protein